MDLTGFEPKYITFDRYGTLTDSQTGEASQMGEAVGQPATDLTGPYDTQTFPTDFRTYQLDAVIADELSCPSRVRHVCRGAMADRRGAGVCMRRPG